MPSLTDLEAVAVTSTTVSPIRATTAPSACIANFPVSKLRTLELPSTGLETEYVSDMSLLSLGASLPRSFNGPDAHCALESVYMGADLKQFPVVNTLKTKGAHHWQLIQAGILNMSGEYFDRPRLCCYLLMPNLVIRLR